jgi:hypothetical protein
MDTNSGGRVLFYGANEWGDEDTMWCGQEEELQLEAGDVGSECTYLAHLTQALSTARTHLCHLPNAK